MTHCNVIQFPSHRINSKHMPDNAAPKEAQDSPKEAPSIQSVSEGFDVVAYLPGGREVKFLESSKGTHQIPHKIFEFMFKATNNKVELVVFACLMRYTLGFHRSTCEASLTFIAEWSGLPVSSVRRGLETLLVDKLITRIEAGNNSRDSAIYLLPIVKGYLEQVTESNKANVASNPSEVEKTKRKTPSINEAPTTPLCSNQAQYCEQNEHSQDQNRHSTMLNLSTKKENTNKETNKTLTPENLTDVLQKFFTELRPERKKQREWEHFQSLRNAFSIQDISDSLDFLLRGGVPGSGQRCHSPMAFLAVSMSSVLGCVTENREKLRRKEAAARQAQERKREEEKESEQESRKYAETLARFNTAFPTQEEQQKYFKEFALKNPMFASSAFMLRNLAISAWGSSQSETLNQI